MPNIAQYLNINGKSVDGMLKILIQNRRMVGSDETTEQISF